MRILHLPASDFRITEQNGKKLIFDRIRRKFVSLTSEEWVRQHFIEYLISSRNVPASLIGVEVSLKVNRLLKRADIVVHNKAGNPCLLVECKAPEVEVTQAVFDQIARYNMAMKVKFLVVTNGLVHYACTIDHEKETYSFLEEVPDYQDMQ